jgi:PAS domain S-box-containing protein
MTDLKNHTAAITENLPVHIRSNISFINQAPSAMAMFDSKMCYLAVSEQWINDYYLSGKDIIGKSHYELSPFLREDWRKIHKECLSGLSQSGKEDYYQKSDGTFKWFKWDVKPWYIDEGVVGGIYIFTADITIAKYREELLYKYQDLLERTNEASRIGTWEVDLVQKLISWSKVTKQIHGVDDDYSPDLETGINFYKEGENRESIAKHFKDCAENGKDFTVELIIINTSGVEKWVKVTGIPVWENDEIVRIYGLFQDIDEKTRANIALALQEEQFRQTFEFAANGMGLIDLKGKWFKVNQSLCKILGYTKDELFNLSFNDITHPDDILKGLDQLDELIKGNIDSYQVEKRYLNKSREVVWVLISVSLVKNSLGEPSHLISQINNITQRKTAQFQLQESISKLQGIQDASTEVCIIEFDIHGEIIFFNKGAENLLGYTANEVINNEMVALFHLKEELKSRAETLSDEFGELVTEQQSVFAYPFKGLFETREWTYVRKDKTTFPILLTVTAIKNNQGYINGFLAIATDISQIKLAEAEVNSLLTLTKEQNERLLNFAHIVSHNLRSHSGNLSMIIELIKMEIPEVTENDFFPLLIEASENLKETIAHLNEVVAMNNKTNENLTQLNLFKYIEKAITNVHGSLVETGGSIFNTVSKDVFVMAIPAYLESILLNMLTNAVKYRSENRKLCIKIDSWHENQFEVITITDNGIGIDLQLHGSKIFGMYKTFHGNEDARGVGLFITKNQIETMGGKVLVESKLDHGTTFKIHLKHEQN